jgi:hypothetical protein
MAESNLPEFDPVKFYLGKVCKRLHNWHFTGKSLRYRSTSVCIECHKFHQSQPQTIQKKICYREANRERLRQVSHDRYWLDPQKYSAQMRLHREANREHCKRIRLARYARNPQKIKLAVKRYYLRHREEILERYRQSYRQDPAKRRIKLQANRKRKAMKRGNHSVPVTKEQLQRRLDYFDGCCAYCDHAPVASLTIDHFIPVAKGGADCLGNIVPACLNCNIEKRDRDPKKWFQAQPFYSKRRWLEILSLLGKSDENYDQIPLL